MELFLNDGLIAENEWHTRIDARKAEAIPATREQLRQAIHEAVKKRIPSAPCGLFFSGGVDSSYLALLLKRYHADFTCYTVGVEGSKDLEQARALVRGFDLPYKEHILSMAEVEDILRTIAPWYLVDERLQDENLAVLFGVAAVEYAAAQLASQEDIRMLFGGLGSEEIFAGYRRHEQAKDINEECWRGLKNMWRRDLLRDCILAENLDIQVRTPFLDPGVITAAMGISGKEKLVGDTKKAVLREIAFADGLPEHFAKRKKLGAQYGSRIDVAIKKLAKRHGFRYKHEYLRALTKPF